MIKTCLADRACNKIYKLFEMHTFKSLYKHMFFVTWLTSVIDVNIRNDYKLVIQQVDPIFASMFVSSACLDDGGR